METNKYKKLLEAEKTKLLKELATVGRKNPSAGDGWEAVETDLDSDSADENETADELEDYEENQGIVDKLSLQLKSVELALDKIKNGTYGTCEVGGEAIPTDRLDANPSATTCIKHTK